MHIVEDLELRAFDWMTVSRIWSSEKPQKLGFVDGLGDLELRTLISSSSSRIWSSARVANLEFIENLDDLELRVASEG